MTLKEKKAIKRFLDNHRDESDRYQRTCEKYNLNHDGLSVILLEMDSYEKAQLKANLISIGNVLFHFVERTKENKKYLSNEEYESTGREFCERIHKSCGSSLEATRDILKRISMGGSVDVLRFLLDWDICIVSKPIKIVYGDACCKITIHKEGKLIDKCEPFYVKDTAYYYDKFCVLDGLISNSNGGGSHLVSEICKGINTPIVLQAGFLFYGEFEIWNNCEYDLDVVENLVKYYENLGFVNINSVIGSYEDSVIMLYCRDTELLQRVTSRNCKERDLKVLEEF